MSKIGDTELIINGDGSIYHLNLKLSDIAETILLVGDPDRVGMVSKYFDRIALKKQKREFVTHTGWLRKKKITVISTGIGTDNIDIVLNELDALVNIDFKSRKVKPSLTSLNFIRIGTSGAIQEDIPVDAFVASEAAIGLDGLMNYYQVAYTPREKQLLNKFNRHLDSFTGARAKRFLVPYAVSASPQLAAKFSGACIAGTTVSTNGFYAPQGRVLRGKLSFRNYLDALGSFAFNDRRITNFEMETSAIYGLSRMLGHHALSCNAIIGNRKTRQFSKNPYRTVDKLIRFVLDRMV